MFMAHVGRNVAENDPLLNPLANPNLRVQDNDDAVLIRQAKANIIMNKLD